MRRARDKRGQRAVADALTRASGARAPRRPPTRPRVQVLFFIGDGWLGKTGASSRVSAHMVMAITGFNTALGLFFGFLFGHASRKQRVQPDGKPNFVGIFAPIMVMLIWIFLFTSQGIMFCARTRDAPRYVPSRTRAGRGADGARSLIPLPLPPGFLC